MLHVFKPIGGSVGRVRAPQTNMPCCVVVLHQQAIGRQLANMANNLQTASQGVSQVMQSLSNGFPGPMLNSTLASIRQQVSADVLQCCR